jgi:hypothetical protein
MRFRILPARRGVPVAVYVYRCARHGITETSRPMGTAEAAIPCPECGAAASRIYTAPRISLGSPARRALIERAERTRDEPDVVSAPPPRPGRMAPVASNPALQRLPRP